MRCAPTRRLFKYGPDGTACDYVRKQICVVESTKHVYRRQLNSRSFDGCIGLGSTQSGTALRGRMMALSLDVPVEEFPEDPRIVLAAVFGRCQDYMYDVCMNTSTGLLYTAG